jgi:predicted transcriptional regulator
MSQQIKIKDAEFSELKMLRQKFEELVFKFGTLQVEKMELDRLVNDFIEKEKKLKEEWISLQKLEEELLGKIASNYGDGNLNVNDGTFTITSPPPPKSE